MSLRSAAAALLAAACLIGADRAPAHAQATDSILYAAVGGRAETFLRMLSAERRRSLVERAAEPRRMLAGFLSALPLSETSVPLTDEERADTIFASLPVTSLLPTSVAFLWGDIASGRATDLQRVAFVPCLPGTGCLAEARHLPRGTALEDPRFAAVGRPDVERFLATPLRVDGWDGVIAEVRHPDAAGRIARAVCVDGVPTIQYSPDISSNFSPLAFAFVRAHEYSHWLEGHVRCGDIQPPPGRGMPPVDQRELDADCAAARIITRDVEFGTGIVVLVAERFWELDWKATDGYPATRDRADGMYRDACEHGRT